MRALTRPAERLTIATSQLILLAGLLLPVPQRLSAEEPVAPPPLDGTLLANLSTWLASHDETPERYVTGLFAKHDVVFLGEQHRVKHDAILVQDLLDPLYQAGVRVLAVEFGRREDQPLIDWLVTRKDWDEALAREVTFRQFVSWGYREYVDLYKAAWALNQRLPKGAPRLRVLGINDAPDWSIMKTQEDRENPEIKETRVAGRRRASLGCGHPGGGQGRAEGTSLSVTS